MILLLLVLLVIQLRSDRTSEGYADAWEGTRGLRIFAKVHAEIKSRFRNPPGDRELFLAAIQGMLQQLNDPYSDYLPPRLHRATEEVLHDAQPGGIGILPSYVAGRGVHVDAVLPDGPADRAGLKSGDLITEINGIPTRLLHYGQIIQRMRGPVGSRVQIYVSRGEKDVGIVNITRGPLPQPRIVHSQLLPDSRIGLIRIYLFAMGTTPLVADAVQSLEKKGAESLILDLRWNQGGALEEGLGVADLFLSKGRVITRIEQRDPSPYAREPIRFTQRSSQPALTTLPVAILLNRVSASASELVTAALQDHRVATVIGSRSFGKARIQELLGLGQYPDADIGALRITVGRYLTPHGRDIEGKGIAPDIPVPLEKEAARALNKRWYFEWLRMKGVAPTETAPDAQLSRAIDHLRKRTPLP